MHPTKPVNGSPNAIRNNSVSTNGRIRISENTNVVGEDGILTEQEIVKLLSKNDNPKPFSNFLTQPLVEEDIAKLKDQYSEEEVKALCESGLSPVILGKLAAPAKALWDANESIQCIQACIRLGAQEVNNAKGKDVVLLIGDTGTGKSTAGNWLSGCILEKHIVKPRRVIVKVSPSSPVKEVMSVGHSGSKTFIPRVSATESLVLCDCPGFFDDRGSQVNVSNAVNIRNVVLAARSVKVVLLIEYPSLLTRRGGVLQMVKKTMDGLFGEENSLVKHHSSLLLGVTKVPMSDEMGSIVTKDVMNVLFDASEDPTRSLPQELMRNTMILDPLNQRDDEGASLQDWLYAISELTPVPNHASIFRTVLTAEDQCMLVDISRKTSAHVEMALANNDIDAAYLSLQCMHSLNVIGNPEVKSLVDNNDEQVNRYFQDKVRSIREISVSFQYQDANHAILRLIRFVTLFRTFNPTYSDDLLQLVKFNNDKRIEKLVNDIKLVREKCFNGYYQDSELRKKIAYPLYKLLCLQGIPIHSAEADGAVNDYLEQVLKLDEMRNLFTDLTNDLKALQRVTAKLNQTDVFKSQQDLLMVHLRQMAEYAKKQYEELALAELVKIKMISLQTMKQLKSILIWENHGHEVLNVLNQLETTPLEKILTALASYEHAKDCVGLLERNILEAKRISDTLMFEHELKQIPQFFSQELTEVRRQLQMAKKEEEARLKKEQEQKMLDEFIVAFESMINLRSFDLMNGLFTTMATFNESQRMSLKQNGQVLNALRTQIDTASRALSAKFNWEHHGTIYLSIYQRQLTIQDQFTAIQAMLAALGEEKSLQAIHPELITLQMLYKCAIGFSTVCKINIQQYSIMLANTFAQLNKEFNKQREAQEKRLQEERLRQEILDLISTTNQCYIPADNFEKTSEALRRIQQIDPKQLSLIALSGKIQSHLEAFNELLYKSEDYASVKQKLGLLETMKKVLGEFFSALGVTLDINACKMEICKHVGVISTKARSEIMDALAFDGIENVRMPLRDFPTLDQFFQLISEFSSLPSILEYKTDMNSSIMKKIEGLFKRYEVSSDAEIYTKMLVQIQYLTHVVGAKDPSLTTTIRVHVGKLIQQRSEDLDFLAKLDDRLSALGAIGDKDSPYANQLVGQYPEFKGAQTRAFIKKTEGRRSENIIGELCGVQHPPLQLAYGIYEKAYLNFLKNIHEQFGQPTDKDLLQGAISSARSQGKTLQRNSSYYQNAQTVALLLANIFGVWSYLDAHRGGFRPRSTTLRLPHSSQIVAIFLLLGIGVQEDFSNHLIEVRTGEGKSIVTAGAAIALSLIGYKVDVACYNPYLAERDETTFAEMFSTFNVDVYYGDFHCISNRCIKSIGNIRNRALSFFKQGSPSGEEQVNRKSTLLVDEVDVLYGKGYLGSTYKPGITLAADAWKELLLEIWDDRIRYASMSEESFIKTVGQSQLMKNFLSVYPLLHHLTELITKKIYSGFIAVYKERHKYVFKAGKIGYLDEVANVVRYNTFHGVSTSFAAVKEFRANKIDTEELTDKVMLILTVGQFSYGELFKLYDHIAGVTGTLFPLSTYEEKILEGYGIAHKTVIPTVFSAKQVLPKESEVQIYDGKLDAEDDKGYYRNIKNKIEGYIAADRAVLVIFETEERLQEYHEKYSNAYKATKVKTNILCATTESKTRDLMINEAATRRTVTLMVCAYGRGSDFVCHDDALRSKGGVAVIITFFPKHPLEEVQYKGRTCRQNDPGSVVMILHLKDLEWLGVETQHELDEADDTIYCYLDSKRQEVLDKEAEEMEKKVSDAKAMHDKTIYLTQLLRNNSIFSSSPTSTEVKNVCDIIRALN